MNIADICRIFMNNISNFKITKKIEKKNDIFGYFRKLSTLGALDQLFPIFQIFVVLIFVFSVPKYIKITPRQKDL